MAVKNKTKRMRGNLWKNLHTTVAKKFSVRVTGITPGGTLRLRKATAGMSFYQRVMRTRLWRRHFLNANVSKAV